MTTTQEILAEQDRRYEQIARTSGIGAAVALALQAKAEHNAHTAKHERHFNCEFCEIASLEAAELTRRKRLVHDRLHTINHGPSPASVYGPQADCRWCEVTLSPEELVREHRGW